MTAQDSANEQPAGCGWTLIAVLVLFVVLIVLPAWIVFHNRTSIVNGIAESHELVIPEDFGYDQMQTTSYACDSSVAPEDCTPAKATHNFPGDEDRIMTDIETLRFCGTLQGDDGGPGTHTAPPAWAAAEDHDFYESEGNLPDSLASAWWDNLAGDGARRGGSNLWMQAVQQMTGRDTRTPEEKLREFLDGAAFVQFLEENGLNKTTLWEILFNYDPLPRNSNGYIVAMIEMFGKDPGLASEQPEQCGTLAENAYLAASRVSPSLYDPWNYVGNEEELARITGRWHYVLDTMAELGFATQEEVYAAKHDPSGSAISVLDLVKPPATPTGFTREGVLEGGQSFVAQAVRDSVARLLGDSTRLFTEEFAVSYSVDDNLVDMVCNAAYGSGAPLENSHLEASIVVIDNRTGKPELAAFCGGRQWDPANQRNDNIALGSETAGRFQIGSMMKPFALIAALESGVPLETEYVSTARGISLEMVDPETGEPWLDPITGKTWNVGGSRGEGSKSLSTGLIVSDNQTYAQLMIEHLTPEMVGDVFNRLSATDDEIGQFWSIVLGTELVKTIDLALAYNAIGQHGVSAETQLITSLVDRDGNQYAGEPEPPLQVVERSIADTVTRDLIEVLGPSGTGRTAGEVCGCYGQVAAKTGTSQELSAGIVMYSPDFTVAVNVIDRDGGPVEMSSGGAPSVIAGAIMRELIALNGGVTPFDLLELPPPMTTTSTTTTTVVEETTTTAPAEETTTTVVETTTTTIVETTTTSTTVAPDD